MRACSAIILIFLAVPALLRADEVALKTGITIKGRVVARDARKVVVVTGGREMSYEADKVAEVKLAPIPEFEEGRRLLAAGKVAAAAAEFEKVVRGEKTLFQEEARACLVSCYLRANRPDEAVTTYLEMLREDPDSRHKFCFPWQYAVSLRDLSAIVGESGAASALGAWAFLGQGKTAEAQERISSLLQSRNAATKEMGLILQLRLLFDQKKTDACLKLADEKEAGASDAVRPWLWYWRGRCLLAKGDCLRAALDLLRVATLYPANEPLAGECLYLAGQCFEKMGRNDRAKREYREAAANFPVSIAADLARDRAAALK